MYWKLTKDNVKTLGFDSFFIDIYAGNWKFDSAFSENKKPDMSISVFEILDYLPRDFVKQYIKWLDEVETHVPPQGQYKERSENV